ncbi:Choline dehydrogenase, mitochondrial [Clonorchis sinensis]|uniref:Choline dehydrogenase, mitochondrial n=1 Tax=Clonorchis sinensis TaxID=79923 RepID=A0A3R7FLG0_CLOSI|nr:Choline dehydrogenase, mitochondrial [Clonorchis sinensis]
MLPAIQSIKQLLLPTGRMVGGTAMLNAMLFSFGHPEDETFQLFSQWNPRFFSELYQEPGRAVTGCHFTPSSNYRHYLNEKFHVALSEVFKSLGLPARDSPDGWVREGMQTPLVFVQDYRRWSPYTNCLEPLLQHKDAQVTILPETLVEKVNDDILEGGTADVRGDMAQWLKHEFTDRKVRGSNPTSVSRLPLFRLGQPGSVSSLVIHSSSMAPKGCYS